MTAELRCPSSRNLFGKILRPVAGGPVIEVACSACKRKLPDRSTRVLHLYSSTGNFLRTQLQTVENKK